MPNDGGAGDQFGRSVSISGDTMVVGSHGDDDKGVDAGAAYAFVRGGTSWSQQAKLTASDGAAGDGFGIYLAIDAESVVVAAPNDDNARGTDAGAAYVFKRNGTSWSQEAKLVASDGAANDHLGFSVAINGDTVLAGASGDDSGAGSAYVFVRTGTTWAQQAKLTASDRASGDLFGDFVGIHGETAVVGALRDDDKGFNSGSAYVFTRTGTVWTQQFKLTATDSAALDEFADIVAINEDTILAGARFDDGKGSVYVFTRSGTTWTQEAKLTASDAAADDEFGAGISIEGDVAIVGSFLDDDNGTDSGSVYVFTRSEATWTQRFKLVAADAAAGDSLAFQVSVSGDTIATGARLDDDLGTNSGSAYAFRFLQAPGAPRNPRAEPGPGLGNITLSWNPPTGAGSETVTSYGIHRALSPVGLFSTIANVTAPATSFVDTGRTGGTTYYYVTAKNGNGDESIPTMIVGASPPSPPTSPQKLSAHRQGSTVELDWLRPAWNGSQPLTTYNIYNSSDQGASYQPLASIDAAWTNHTAPGCTPECFYQVTTNNSLGESPPSNPAADLPQFHAPPLESIRGTTPGEGGNLKQAFACDDPPTGSVNLVSGQLIASACLLQLRSPHGLDVTLRLTHRSNAGVETVVGKNWDLSALRRIDVDGNGDAYVSDGSGRTDRFPWDAASSTFVSPPGFYQNLTTTPAGGFEIMVPGGIVESFNPQGSRTSVRDPSGNAVNITNDFSGRPVQIRDTHGRTITFAYTGQNLTRIHDWTGRVASLTQDKDRDLIAISMQPTSAASGPTHQFTYTADHSLANATDPRGQTYLRNTYDASGRVAAHTHGAGTFHFAYDPDNSSTNVTDGNGHTTRWTYVSPAEPVPVNKTAFSTRGVRDATEETQYESNANLEITKLTLPGGRREEWVFDENNSNPLARGNLLQHKKFPATGTKPPQITSYTYESTFQGVRNVTTPRGNDPTYVPPNGGSASADRYTTRYWYGQDEIVHGDRNGDGQTGWPPNQVVRIDHPKASSQNRSELFEYDNRGRLVRHTAPDGAVTSFQYYGANQDNPEGFVQSITRTPELDAAPAGGSASSIAMAGTAENDEFEASLVGSGDGGNESFELDGSTESFSSESSSETSSTSAVTEYRFTFTYDEGGNVASVTDPGNRTTNYTYDALDRPIQVLGPAPGRLETGLSYDLNGNLARRNVTNAVQALNGSYIVDASHPFLVQTFEKYGLRYFSMPAQRWTWEANELALERAVKRGDDFVKSGGPIHPGVFNDEIEWLLKRGIRPQPFEPARLGAFK